MGLFSKSVTQVGTNVTRVIADDNLPSSIRSGVVRSIFDDDTAQMVEYAMEELVQGIGMRAERMYEYGRDGYTYGVPNSVIRTSKDAQPQVQSVIDTLAGGAATLDYYHFGMLNYMHLGWYTLFAGLGYNQATNEITSLTASVGFKTYLKDVQVVVSTATFESLDTGALDQWSAPPNGGFYPGQQDLGAAGAYKAPTPFMVDPVTVTDYLNLTYAWEIEVDVKVGTTTNLDPTTLQPVVVDVFAKVKTPMQHTLKVSLVGYNTEADWHQVKYTRAGVTGYWLYRAGAGTYPAIDAAYTQGHDPLGSFFPFAYFRYNKTSMGVNVEAPEYKSSKKLTEYLGMDYDMMVDSIHQNPDIANVEQAMLMMAVPAKTSDPLEQRYLFDFFSRISDQTSGDTEVSSAEGYDTLAVLNRQGLASNDILIQDARFKMSLSYRNIVKRKVSGVLGDGKIGNHASTYVKNPVVQTGTTPGGAPITFNTELPCHTYQRQITETLYEEVQVYGLKMTYYIFNEYTSVGDEDDAILLIPLDHSITEEYSISDREVLYSRSLHYIFNSRVVTDLAWYQTSIFRAIILIAAIVITILDWGSDGGSVIGAALGLTGVSALVATIIVNVIIGKLLTTVFKLFVRTFGQQFAILVAVVAILYGAYQVFDVGSIAGAPWASEMLQVANGLTNAVMQDKFNDLLDEGNAFNMMVDEKTKKLEEADKLLEHNNYLTPMIIFGENPTDFYQRTVHSGNIGVLGLDAISSYVDALLTLPKLNETVGDTFYG